jgi:hypothetical protein
MRWLLLIVCASLVAAATQKRECSTAEWAAIGYEHHDPAQRADKLWQWLTDYGPACTRDQLTMIYINLPTVTGTADSMRMRARIEQLWEKAK